MQETRQNLYVGLFVLAGLVIFGALVVLFGSEPTAIFGGGDYRLIIQFRSAAGMRKGNQVTVGGLTVGRVQDVAFLDARRLDAGVNVTVLIEAKYPVPEGSRAVTTEPGLGSGRPPIEIIPGPAGAAQLQPGATIPGEVRGALAGLIPPEIISTLEKTAVQIGDAADNLSPVLKDVHEILVARSPADVDRPGGPQGNLSSAMARADAAIKHFNEVLGDPEVKSRIKESIDNIHKITEDGKTIAADLKDASGEIRTASHDAKDLVQETRTAVKDVKDEVASVSRSARDTLERGSRLLDSVYETSSSINRGEGTVGRLIRDPKLYEALVLTTERLGQTIEEFRVLIKEWQKGKIRVAF